MFLNHILLYPQTLEYHDVKKINFLENVISLHLSFHPYPHCYSWSKNRTKVGAGERFQFLKSHIHIFFSGEGAGAIESSRTKLGFWVWYFLVMGSGLFTKSLLASAVSSVKWENGFVICLNKILWVKSLTQSSINVKYYCYHFCPINPITNCTVCYWTLAVSPFPFCFNAFWSDFQLPKPDLSGHQSLFCQQLAITLKASIREMGSI